MFPATLLGSESSDFKWTKVNYLMSTEYLNYESAKFSKSRGIGVFGDDAISSGISADVYRFYLIYTRPENSDSAFKWDDLSLKNNSELLANLGNFVNRSLKFCKVQFGGKIGDMSSFNSAPDKLFLAQVNQALATYMECMEKTRQRESVSALLSICRLGNQLMQAEQPWKQVKSNEEQVRARAAAVVGVCVNLSALIAVLVQPIMPQFSETILKQINVSLDAVNELSKSNPVFTCTVKTGHLIGDPEPLVKEIKSEEAEAYKKRYAGPQSQRETTKVNAKFIPKLEEALKSQESVLSSLKLAKADKNDIKLAQDLVSYLKLELSNLK